MIRLSTLIESAASEDAKKRGLTHGGGGTWKDSSGKTVAKTVKGKLVPYSKEDPEPKKKAKKEEPKKSGNQISVERYQKQADAIEKTKIMDDRGGKLRVDGYSVDMVEGYHVDGEVVEDIGVIDPKFSWGIRRAGWLDLEDTPENRELVKRQAQWAGMFARNDTFLNRFVNDLPSSVVLNNIDKEILALDYNRRQWELDNEEGQRASAKQAETWRIKQHPAKQLEMLDHQRDWQGAGQYGSNAIRRKERNKFINEFCMGKGAEGTGNQPVSILPVSREGAIYRGMSITSRSEAQAFLDNFRVGGKVIMPPSGFSLNEGIARSFLGSERPGVSILFKIKPNRNTGLLRGLALAHAATNHEEFKKKIHKMRDAAIGKEPQISDYDMDDEDEGTRYWEDYEQWQWKEEAWVEREFGMSNTDSSMIINKHYYASTGYDEETEVIVPGTVRHKVKSVKKYTMGMIDYGRVEAKCLYEIELEEWEDAPPSKIMESSRLKKIVRKALFMKYLNNSVRQTPRKKKK